MASSGRYFLETVKSRAGQTVLEVLADVQYPTAKKARVKAKSMQKPGLLVRVYKVCAPASCRQTA